MNISLDVIEYIEKVVKTAQSVKIDNLTFEDGIVRALDEARTVVLFQTDDVPDLPFGALGLTRLSVFSARLAIAKSQNNFNVKAIINDEDDYVRFVTMNADKTKIDYRCSNPVTLKAPRGINDELVYKIQINAEAVSLLQKGKSAMDVDLVTFVWNEEGVSFLLTDINDDEMIHTFADSVEVLEDGAPVDFKHNYPIETILALFKQNPDGEIRVGIKGILGIKVNDLNVYVLPKV